jgi:site-specific DNA-methyltransferase (adenine-specific)
METKHTIINGDCRQMHLLSDASVHLIVTSPPYWQLKDYGTEDQIGYHDSYERYINTLNRVWSECYRVLHQGCRLCINIGDQFARSAYYGRYKVIPIRTEIIKCCEILGFDYMGAIIWQKATTTNTSGGAVIMGSFPYPRNGIIKIDYEFILLFKKQGKAPQISSEHKERSRLSKEEWNTYFAGHWNFSGVKQDKHLAMFPEELPARLIKMFSFVGETVLDPFLGSGTTALAAKKLSRNSVGYEINPDFIEVIKKKLNIYQSDIAQTEYEFLEDRFTGDAEAASHDVPYVFHDPHALDARVDPKERLFGSKIDCNSQESEEYFSVKEVLSPVLLRLDNDKVIRLVGIKERTSAREQALCFLRKKTKGQKVFFKVDAKQYDEKQNILCYLYLKNKTFVNAHLLKQNLADVDLESNFKYKNRFIKICDAANRLSTS